MKKEICLHIYSSLEAIGAVEVAEGQAKEKEKKENPANLLAGSSQKKIRIK